MIFKLESELKPQGDQPKAIEQLTKNIAAGEKNQVLHGVTGSGKTFTMASVIKNLNRPSLVISHNKTLAWQLYQEFKEFFPKNAIHYFVSYYDYYQPEAYMPQTDTYIAKDASINKKIDKMRHAAVQSLLTRKDTLVVASVSCIYGIGSPYDYQTVSLTLNKEQSFERRALLHALTSMGFKRNNIAPESGNFRAKGGRIEIYPPTGDVKIAIELEGKKISSITVYPIIVGAPDASKTGGVYGDLRSGEEERDSIKIFPANFWVAPENKLKIAAQNIRAELHDRAVELRGSGREAEAHRLEQKTNYDLEIIEQTGSCPGIENYSRHLDFREPGSPPFTLIDYFSTRLPLRGTSGQEGAEQTSSNFLTFIDESHITLPQVRGMYAGDKARKTTLIEHGFRLPSALDNRPLTFPEFNKRIGQTAYVSATPKEYEVEISGRNNIVEQIVRPTGLLDPPVEVRQTKDQMADAISELKKVKEKGQRALVVALTKRLSEDVAEYIEERDFKVNYIHSEVHTLERPKIMKKLREGGYDVLVGVNLLREGLDLPEVSLVIIFDADKEGFLRNETTLLQTVGRAARHIEGRAILYADVMTGSIKATLRETERRRKLQKKYNEKHGITPRTIIKKIYDLPEELAVPEEDGPEKEEYKGLAVKELEKEMRAAAKNMDFEKAAKLRDEIKKLSNGL
ncbi:MAG: excinuclease ABC subunit UvrB [Candidatus Spechtbacterales bacterium]